MFQISEFAGGHNEGVWALGDVVPSGIRVWGRSPPEAEVFFWKYTVKNAHFLTITLHLNNCAQFAEYLSKLTDKLRQCNVKKLSYFRNFPGKIPGGVPNFQGAIPPGCILGLNPDWSGHLQH